MKIFKLPLPARKTSDEDAELAATLRYLACEVERGAVDRLVITLVRPDGAVERLGNIPSITKIS